MSTSVFKYHADLLAFLHRVDPPLLINVLPNMIEYVKEGAALRDQEFAVRLEPDHRGASKLQLVTMGMHNNVGYTERVAITTSQDVTTLMYTIHRVLRVLYESEPLSSLGTLVLVLKQWTDYVLKHDLPSIGMSPDTVYPEYYLTWEPPCNRGPAEYSPPVLTGWDDQHSPILSTKELQKGMGMGWVPVPPALISSPVQRLVGYTLSSIMAHPSVRVDDWSQWATYVVAVQTQQQLCAIRTNQWAYNPDSED